MYRYFQWSVIILATITPVLAAIPFDKSRRLAVVIAALVAIGTTILMTSKYRESWINHRAVSEALRKKIYFYRVGLGDYRDSDDREALFVERVESLISRENTIWFTAQRPKEGKESSP